MSLCSFLRPLALACLLGVLAAGLGVSSFAASAGGPVTQGGPPATAPATPIPESGGSAPSFTIGGAVGSPATYALANLQALPSETKSVQYDAGQGAGVTTG